MFVCFHWICFVSFLFYFELFIDSQICIADLNYWFCSISVCLPWFVFLRLRILSRDSILWNFRLRCVRIVDWWYAIRVLNLCACARIGIVFLFDLKWFYSDPDGSRVVVLLSMVCSMFFFLSWWMLTIRDWIWLPDWFACFVSISFFPDNSMHVPKGWISGNFVIRSNFLQSWKCYF